MFVYIIAVAAGIGSLVGAFFRVRLTALLWTAPVLCFLYGASVFLAPYVQANEAAPETLRAIILEVSDLRVFVPMLIAGAAGAIFASSLTRYVQPQDGRSTRVARLAERRRIEHASEGSSKDRLRQRAEQLSRDRVDLERRAATPLPVFEVANEPPFPPQAAAALDTSPAPRPAPPPSAPPANNRREQGRRRSALAGQLVFEDGTSLGCTIQDLSVGGARVRLMGPWPQSRLLGLRDLTHGIGHEVTLRWKAGPIAGVRFTASYRL